MDRPSWDDVRVAMARELARRSLCTRDQVGAIITDIEGKIIGEGYNGPPRYFDHSELPCTHWCRRASGAAEGNYLKDLSPDYGDCPSLHAEANALMSSDRSLRRRGTIFVTSHVCSACAKLIANSGLGRLVVAASEEHAHRRSDETYDWLATNFGIHVNVNGSAWHGRNL